MAYPETAYGESAGLIPVPRRRDHSVNGGFVEYWNTTSPILRTNTDVNAPGAFNGGGIGNKAILGHFLDAPLPLGLLASLDYTTLALTPEVVGPPNIIPYFNLVVELDPIGDPGNLSILVGGDVNNPLNLGAYSTPAVDRHRTLWTPGANFLMCVLDKKLCTFPNPPGPVIVPTSQGGPQGPTSATWQAHDYSIANILATYPNARIVNGSTLDGGMPKTTVTAGIMLIIGSSGGFTQNLVQLLEWKLNGVSI